MDATTVLVLIWALVICWYLAASGLVADALTWLRRVPRYRKRSDPMHIYHARVRPGWRDAYEGDIWFDISDGSYFIYHRSRWEPITPQRVANIKYAQASINVLNMADAMHHIGESFEGFNHALRRFSAEMAKLKPPN